MLITQTSEAHRTPPSEIYSTLTTDTIPRLKKPVDSTRLRRDSSAVSDTLPPQNRVDTFSYRFSRDTLDAPVNYEAADSGVLLVKEKKFLLYGKTRTTYKQVTLTAPRVELDQQTNVLTAVNAADSARNSVTRARFSEGTEAFESDTIRYNFKTQRGLTVNTFTRAQEMFVQAAQLKKINATTAFARRVIMTTCDYDDPHFGFVGNKGKFINDKIAITGPIHPEFEGVPIPIYLPFGIFPLKQGRHSGLLPPNFTVNEQFGLGLEGLGYYHVINDYFDVTVRTNIYSFGGWSANIIPSYRVRYRYQGSLSFAMQHNKFNFKGDPDYNLVKTFSLGWTHSVDPRARPGTTFSAQVNVASTRYNTYLANNPNRNFQNQMQSSIAYSKSWQADPNNKWSSQKNLTLSANHSQNNNNHEMQVTLPDAGFTISTIYPFQKKDQVGAAKWYEKVGIGYSAVARNQVAFYDTAKNTLGGILDTMLWGAQHRFPISMTLPPLGPLIVAPFISYEETWLTDRVSHRWNPTTKKVDTLQNREGLFIDRQTNFGLSVNTALFGTKYFKHGSLYAIRHVMRPSVSLTYKPNLSKKFYDRIITDTTGRYDILPQIDTRRNLFSSYGYGKFGGLTFQVDNNLEMKVRNRKDTTGKDPFKRIRLIDGFGFNSGYNFLQDSMQLLPFNLYLRTTLFEKISITAAAVWNPYQQDLGTGRYINKFVWQGNRFRLGRLSGGSVSASTSFQSKPRDPSKGTNKTNTSNANITDPTLLADRERLQDYIRRNPAEFVDFNIPWSINLSYSLYFNPELQNGRYKTVTNSNLNFSNSFSLTPKWNFSTNGYLDIKTKQLTMFTMSVSRDMHCWQMSINVTPIGLYRSFNITINPKSSILQDLRVNRTRTFFNY